MKTRKTSKLYVGLKAETYPKRGCADTCYFSTRVFLRGTDQKADHSDIGPISYHF